MDDADWKLIRAHGGKRDNYGLGVVILNCSEENIASLLNEARSEGRKAADTALSERVAELERGLELCAAQFGFYALQHAAKHTAEADAKAEVNQRLADKCRALLHPSEGEAGT